MKLYSIPITPHMDFNKLMSSKRQANLSNKAQAYVDGNIGTKHKTISNNTDVNQDDNNTPEEPAPKKGRMSQNSSVGLVLPRASNPRVSTVISGSATSSTSLGNDTPALKIGRSTQIDGASRLSLSWQASVPCTPLASRLVSSRASLGSVGDATLPTEPSVETEVLTSDMETGRIIEVRDSDEEPENTNSDTEEAQQKKLGKSVMLLGWNKIINEVAVRLKKTWTSCVYAFFHSEPKIEKVNRRWSHVFRCWGKGCKATIHQFLDTTDAHSTDNMRKHVRACPCWGDVALTAADSAANADEVRTKIVSGILKNGSITEAFE